MQQTRPDDSKDKAYIERVVSINRVTKVTKGGKNLGFSAVVVIGDGTGEVGYALGKANEVAGAIAKGIRKARKNLKHINKKGLTIPHEVIGQYGAARVLLKPASPGTGVIASSTIRAICECAGIEDILTKILKKTTNPINVVKATLGGLADLKGRPESLPVKSAG